MGLSRLAAVESRGTQGLYPARFRFSGVVTWGTFSLRFPRLIHLACLHEVTLEPLALIEQCFFPLKPAIVDTCAAERGAICRNYDR